jgi:hypothetical protein
MIYLFGHGLKRPPSPPPLSPSRGRGEFGNDFLRNVWVQEFHDLLLSVFDPC